MLVHVVGKCPSARIIKATGERVNGTELHITRPPTDMEREKGQTGSVCKNFFTQFDCSAIPDNTDAEIKYESFGPADTHICAIVPVTRKAG